LLSCARTTKTAYACQGFTSRSALWEVASSLGRRAGAPALHRLDHPYVAPWRIASHALCYEWVHSRIAPEWGPSALFSAVSVAAASTYRGNGSASSRACGRAGVRLALIARSARCSTGDVKQANHRPLRLVPGLDRLRGWQQLQPALLALEIVCGFL